MFAMAICLRGQAKHEGPTRAMRLAALLGVLILTSVAVNALIVVADSNVRLKSPAATGCSTIAQMADRLACYDKLASQPAPHPYKGANAPALGRSL
jgi:hypothetical protein